jgi:hypothetical protein
MTTWAIKSGAERDSSETSIVHSANTVSVQEELNRFYLRELAPPHEFQRSPRPEEYVRIHQIEDEWNAFEEARINVSELPLSADAFHAWYNGLHRHHTRQVSQFFEYLAHEASLEEVNFYVSMEEQVDGRFDDVIALAQLGMTGDMKLALAENYWDEMGLGHIAAMHTVLFRHSSESLQRLAGFFGQREPVPVEAFKNGNLLLMYALRRRYFPRLLGALAILEHTAPYRFAKTVEAMRRLKLPDEVVYYHELHIEVDANHGKQLLNRVLLPLAEMCPEAIRELCIGCLIRFNVAVDYYKGVARTMTLA